MKYISALLSHLRPMQILASTLLAAVLFFASGCSELAAKSNPAKGTVQLDRIEQKTQEAIDSPAVSLKTMNERSKGGPNEVQGDADRNKMSRSSDTELPVVKETEKAFNKMKKS